MAANKSTSNSENNDEAGYSSVQSRNSRESSKRANSTYASKQNMKRRKLKSTDRRSISDQPKLIDDLPSEILETILQNVSSLDLLKCRQLNRKFNEITSRIMRQRDDIKLSFSFVDGKFMQNIPYLRFKRKSLADLVVCLKVSVHFPMASFHFDDLGKFGNEDMKSFLALWGTNIFAPNIHLVDPNTVEMLRELLIKKAPNLKRLQINFKCEEIPSSIKLFVNSSEFRLPKLRVLCVHQEYRKCRPIIGDILQAACNLKNFICYINKKYQDCISTEDLVMLQSFNKIHCLKNVRISLSEDFISSWSESLKSVDLKVHTLTALLQPSVLRNSQLILKLTEILNQLFHSSKDVIHTMIIQSLGWLAKLNLPKFKNLQKLDLYSSPIFRMKYNDLLPPLYEIADIFPNLKDLSVEIPDSLTSQPLKRMYNVEVLRIRGNVSGEYATNLMEATPNVTTLLIEDWTQRNISINFQTVANCLPKLQYFGWLISTSTHDELQHSLDAAITGFPIEFCEEHAKKLRNRINLSTQELAFYQLQPRNSSIFDLKDLKQLEVTFVLYDDDYTDNECDCENSGDECETCTGQRDEAGFTPNSMFFQTGFTKVSKLLAFDLMPDLIVQTHKMFV